MAQGVTHAVGTSRPEIVASAPDGVDDMLIFSVVPRVTDAQPPNAAASATTPALIDLPKPGCIYSQPKDEINSNCTKIVNSRTRAKAAFCGIGYIRLVERESDQARTQQQEAGRGQCEKPVGDNVVVAHVTPATLDARPNLLKLSESSICQRSRP
jgi:hypothetical protein